LIAIVGYAVKSVWDYVEAGNDSQFDPNTGVGIKHTFTAAHMIILGYTQLDREQK
jgi:hypothetical protein